MWMPMVYFFFLNMKRSKVHMETDGGGLDNKMHEHETVALPTTSLMKDMIKNSQAFSDRDLYMLC